MEVDDCGSQEMSEGRGGAMLKIIVACRIKKAKVQNMGKEAGKKTLRIRGDLSMVVVKQTFEVPHLRN